MKRVMMAFLVFSAMPALAAPFAFRGDYVFKNRVSPLGRNTVDVIDTRAGDAADRLVRLRQMGAGCQALGASTVRCVTAHTAAGVPGSTLNNAILANQGLQVSFGASRGPASLVSSASSVTEWSVPQPGRWAGGEFSEYRYLELAGGLAKMELPGARESLWLNTTDGRSLGMAQTIVTRDSRWRWHEDIVSVELEAR